MSNELLWIILLAANFIFVLIFFFSFGKKGLFIWTGISMILANIQVVETISLFGFVVTLGNITYGSTFLITDILGELYGKEEARKSVYVGFVSILAMVVIMNITLFFKPHESDFAAGAIKTIFSPQLRIVTGSFIAYLISQFHDVWAYDFWKKKTNSKFSLIFIRNNLSTFFSQILDSVIFCFIAFWGVFETEIFISILISTVVMKWIVAAADTPFIYLAAWMKGKNKIKEF